MISASRPALAIGLDDATTARETIYRQRAYAHAPSGNGYYTFTPAVGISWLHAGWNVSAELSTLSNLKTTATRTYQSGQQFAADYTVTYTCGKWTFGAGAGQETAGV